MKAVIHVGTPKSGTTTIQSFLTLNRSALISQDVRYEPFDPRNVAQMELGLAGMIRAGDTVDAANKQWALGARTPEAQRAYVDRFDASLAEGVKTWPESTYLASSEQIFAWLSNPGRVQALHDFLSRHFDSIHYIVYFRPQHELMLSSYSERIKRGELLTFEDHFADRLPKMNWHRRTELWTSIVGRDNFSVRLLDKGRLTNGDLLDDFCAVAGLDRGKLQTPPRMNESLSAEQIALFLRIGRYVPLRLRRGSPNPMFTLVKHLLQWRLPKPGTRITLTEAQRTAIRAQNATTNERVRAEFFPHETTLFSAL